MKLFGILMIVISIGMLITAFFTVDMPDVRLELISKMIGSFILGCMLMAGLTSLDDNT